MVCAQMLIWLDTSILNIALTTLADPVKGLGATPAGLEWIASSYTLVFAGTLFAGGALADRFGPRTTLFSGLLIFATASAAGAFAGTPGQLIAARAFMGAGSALLMPSTLSIIVQSTPEAKRARAIAIWSSSSGLGVALGPFIGGMLLSHFWWGSVFLVNVPLVALCLVGVVAVVPDLRAAQRRALDLPGLALSVVGLFSLVYGIIELGRQDMWYGPQVLIPVLDGLVLIAVFVAVQRRSAAPSLDLRLFRQSGFAAGSVVLLLAFMGLSGQLFVMALYFQGPRGLSPATTGTVMIAAAVGIILGSQVSPVASRQLSARWTVAIGMLATGAAAAGQLWFDEQTPILALVVMLWVQGFGMGLIGAAVTTVMMSGVPPYLAGAGSAVGSVTRQVGSTLGVSIIGSILSGVQREEMAATVSSLPPQVQEQARTSAEAARALAEALHLPGLAEAADRAFLNAMYVAVFWVSVLSLAGFAVSLVGLRVRGRHRRPRSRFGDQLASAPYLAGFFVDAAGPGVPGRHRAGPQVGARMDDISRGYRREQAGGGGGKAGRPAASREAGRGAPG